MRIPHLIDDRIRWSSAFRKLGIRIGLTPDQPEPELQRPDGLTVPIQATVCRRPSNQRGSVLLITLVTVAIMGISMASYLDLVSNQNLSTARSQQWNAAIPIIEAGLEEALTQLYYNSTNLSANDWELIDDVYTKERTLGASKFVVTISQHPKPIIISKAYVPAPMGNGYLNPPRTVKVTVRKDALFAKGMVAKGNIDMSGNNVRSDSFDSADPSFSTNGQYDPTKWKDGGDVATNSGLVNSLDVGNANIYGKASTGPGGSISVGSSGGVGSKVWQEAGNTGVQDGWSSDDMNVQFPDVEPPFSGGATAPTSGTIDGLSYTYVLGSGNWQLNSLSLSGQNNMIVTGEAILYVLGNVSVSGNAYIEVSTNAFLQMYVGGSSTSLNGNGVVNLSGNATNFFYLGLPSNTSVDISGNGSFIGVLYAPQAALHLGGGGNNTQDFVGATISNTVQMNGHFNFHYDENLARIGPNRGFVVDSWNETFTWEEM